MPAGTTVAILLAAGSSERMDGPDKLWFEFGGEPLIAQPLRMLAQLDAIETLIVVAPAARHEQLRALADGVPAELRCVEGGRRRRDSVAAGIAAAPDAAWYVIHDAARPLASAGLTRRVIAAAREHGAALPALPVVDTIKRVDTHGTVVETLPREALRAAQTPQVFSGDLLRRAHREEASEDATDDAALVERLGERVQVVEGEAAALKVTVAADLEAVQRMLDPVAAAGSE